MNDRVLAACAGHLNLTDAEVLTRPNGIPPATELGRSLRIAVQSRVGIRVDESGQTLWIRVIRVLMRYENGVEAGHALETVREIARIEEDFRTVQFDKYTGMAKMCQSHDFEYAFYGWWASPQLSLDAKVPDCAR